MSSIGHVMMVHSSEDMGQNEPEISPLKGFHIPSKPKMPQTQADLAVYVKSLLVQMQGRFTDMSDGLVGRIDELGAQIDALESSISTLIQKGKESQE